MRVRTGKVVKARSSLGNQTSLTFNSASANNNYLGAGNSVYLKYGSAYIRNIGAGFNITLDSTHKYFLLLKIGGTVNNNSFHVYYANDDSQASLESTEYKSTTDKIGCAILTGETKFRAAHLYSYGSSFDSTSILKYYILVDLTVLGLDTLTAQQFYNKYKNYLELLATGEEITIDRGSGKIMTENSSDDIISCNVTEKMYGYNSIFDFSTSTWTNDNADTFTMTKTTDKISFECHTAGSRNNKGITSNISVVAGHKYLLSYDILSTVSYNLDTSGNTVNPTTVINMYPTSIVANELTNVQMIVQAENTLTWRMGRGSTTVAVGDTLEFTNIYIIDLTDWFDTGKEPTTVAEFKAKFNKDYYGFCKNKIMLTKNMINALPVYGYNQWMNANTHTRNGIIFDYDKNTGLMHIHGTATANVVNQQESAGKIQTVVGHVYYSTLGYKTSTFGSEVGNNEFKIPYNQIFRSNGGTTERIWTETEARNVSVFSCAIFSGNTVDFYFRPMCIDLTEWYGAGNEPSTIAEFKATFPHKYYQYMKKSLLNRYQINALGK